MIVTEAQAEKLWCPRTSVDAARDCCLGSACMVWRWVQFVGRRFRACDDVFAATEPQRPEGLPDTWEFCKADDDEPAGWAETQAEANLRRTGYCGLAPIVEVA